MFRAKLNSEEPNLTHHDPQGLEYPQVPLLQAEEDQPEVLHVLLSQIGRRPELINCGRFWMQEIHNLKMRLSGSLPDRAIDTLSTPPILRRLCLALLPKILSR